MHDEKASDIMRTVAKYISTVSAGAGTRAGTGHGNITIELDPEGFPIAPSPESWGKITKVDLEKLYRSYVTHQYREFTKLIAVSQ